MTKTKKITMTFTQWELAVLDTALEQYLEKVMKKPLAGEKTDDL